MNSSHSVLSQNITNLLRMQEISDHVAAKCCNIWRDFAEASNPRIGIRLCRLCAEQHVEAQCGVSHFVNLSDDLVRLGLIENTPSRGISIMYLLRLRACSTRAMELAWKLEWDRVCSDSLWALAEYLHTAVVSHEWNATRKLMEVDVYGLLESMSFHQEQSRENVCDDVNVVNTLHAHQLSILILALASRQDQNNINVVLGFVIDKELELLVTKCVEIIMQKKDLGICIATDLVLSHASCPIRRDGASQMMEWFQGRGAMIPGRGEGGWHPTP